MSVTSNLYRPIQEYQTRVIQLHGHNGSLESPLRCSLITAYILHACIEGLALFSTSNKDDQHIQYEALSYYWGGDKTPETIICNGISFPIGSNLFEALQALRPSNGDRYRWTDAICINQNDKVEVAKQVSIMFYIYEKASCVIIWLGNGSKIRGDAISILANAPEQNRSALESEGNFWTLFECLKYCYTSPWFKRIWVQQEFFAARQLMFICGNQQLVHHEFLINPGRLWELPYIQKSQELRRKKNLEDNSSLLSKGINRLVGVRSIGRRQLKPLEKTPSQLRAVYELTSLHRSPIHTFARLAKEKKKADLINTLLITGSLHATNLRDYLYAMLGITDFPSKPMSIDEWQTARQHEVFIPIDYSASLESVWTAATWAMLMIGGLAVISKFKIFGRHKNESQLSLPSWAVDWRLTAPHSTERELWPEYRDGRSLTMQKIEDGETFYFGRENRQAQFNSDNRGKIIPLTKLVLRGVIDKRYYLMGNQVWKKAMVVDKVAFDLDFEVESQDMIVYFLALHGSFSLQKRFIRDRPRYLYLKDKGLWVIRPVGDDNGTEFELKACLQFTPEWNTGLYNHWQPRSYYDHLYFPQGQEKQDYRRLAVSSRKLKYIDNESNPLCNPFRDEYLNVRTFIIV